MRKESSNTSKGILAIILIAIGMLWLLSQIGVHFNFPKIHFEHIFYPIHSLFKNFGHIIFSWPSLLIIIGLILMAEKPKVGGCINCNRWNISFAPDIFRAGDNYFNSITGSFNCNRDINGSQETLEELICPKCPVFICFGQYGAI